ncbi:intracellular endo-alpha-(1-_5)-L-arabinanase [Abditibacteriota bacterium]|nr:intracellular endo-alpha-(1->5)-L-arabinanase [Abditibacteriota bacterium]
MKSSFVLRVGAFIGVALLLVGIRNWLTPAPQVQAAPLEGEYQWVHDPSRVVKCGDAYYVFYTSNNIQNRTSSDLKTWNKGASVFEKMPDWVRQYVPNVRGNNIWAPDIIFYKDKYWLFYSVSTFGSRVSVIGLATNATLDPQSPNYKWNDNGLVIASTQNSSWNAIDPAPLTDEHGDLWLSFGSFQRSGIQLVKLDSQTGKAVGEPTTLAARQNVGPEAPFIQFHDGWYYLFENEGFCCRGMNSTYAVMVGRSKTIAGPYLDKTGRDLARGGGTLFLGSNGEQIGPGHIGVLTEGNLDRFTFHYYNALANGVPTLGMKTLAWDKDGWPYAAKELAPGRYAIISRVSGLGLGVHNLAQDDGTPIDQFKYTGGPFQEWNIAPLGDGYFNISSLATGKSTDLFECGAADGTKISLYGWMNNDCQRWRIEPTSDGFYRILSKGAKSALTLPGGTTTPQALVAGYAPTGKPEQEWELRPVP